MSNFYDHLDQDIKNILLAQIRNLWTHNSTAIEGNSLTLGETAFILEEGLTVQGKPLKDHNEVYGHAKAIEIIYALLTTQNITKQDIFTLHETVLVERIRDIDQPVGDWKRQPNFTTYVGEDKKQAWREYPSPRNIDRLMSQWLDNLNASLSNAYTSQEAAGVYADLHLSFVSIHPFFDGNSRMGRLLANLPVLKSGFPPIVVPGEGRYQYNSALSGYQNTIPDLASLSDLEKLPDNVEKNNFVGLCKGYWSETLELVNTANQMQKRRGID